MSDRLREIDPELLLQELKIRRARAAGEPGIRALTRRAAPAVQPFAELANFATEEIVDALRAQQKVIYGTDDRQDIYEVADRSILTDAASVVAIMRANSIADNGDGTSTLNGPTHGDNRNLCDTEPFREQPVIPYCSGFLVDPSIVATAAHCIETSDLDSARFVFGFQMRDQNTAETRIANDEIYRGIRILGREIGTAGTDWALVQLDRPVLNHPVVRIRRSGTIDQGQGVHVIGHPSGLPKKYAGGAEVRDNSPARYFVANLDTYGGNSGSPVFNEATHVVEGILVRGETDYVWQGNCQVSNVCPENGCRGEDCTKTTEFESLVPQSVQDCIAFDGGRAEVVHVSGAWKIVVGNIWLLDFGSNQAEANRALEVIKHYGMNNLCFVGRPNPSMEYYLVNGAAPEGGMPGDDCIAFDPDNLEVKQVRGRWKIVDGDVWLMDFDQQEDEARQALSNILRHGFRAMCFVGRPDPSMTYFRK